VIFFFESMTFKWKVHACDTIWRELRVVLTIWHLKVKDDVYVAVNSPRCYMCDADGGQSFDNLG